MSSWVLFCYNSLPEMPDGCKLFTLNLLHRDFFKCNPRNTGHYQHPKFETISYDSGCHKKEVKQFRLKKDDDKYLIFYTRYVKLDKSSKNMVVGYFKVESDFEAGDVEGFHGSQSESILLSKENCLPISYNSRGVPNSWGKSAIKERVSEILILLKQTPSWNVLNEYQAETSEIMKKLTTRSGREEIIFICQECDQKFTCFWGRNSRDKMEQQLIKLYGALSSCNTN